MPWGHLPELPSYPRAPAKGKEGGTANVVKDYSSHPGWGWLKMWWLWEQKQNSASEQMPLMGWLLNPGEEQALMDLSVRPALHMYLWLQARLLLAFISKKKIQTLYPCPQIMIFLRWGGPANPGAHATECISLVVGREEVHGFGVSPQRQLVAWDVQSARLLAKSCFSLMSFKQPCSHLMHWFLPRFSLLAVPRGTVPLQFWWAREPLQWKASCQRKSTPSTM